MYDQDEFDDTDICGDCGSPFDDFGWCPLCDYDSGFNPDEIAALESFVQWDISNADSLYVDECLADDGDIPF